MSGEMGRFTVEPICKLPRGCVINAVTEDGHVLAICPEDDGRVRFCWDGSCGEPFDGLMELRDKSWAIFASADGNHLAYVGQRGSDLFVGRDDREDPPLQDFSRSVPPVFGGDHLAYGGRQAGGEFRLILDGQPTGSAEVAPIAATFSADGERLAYAEMRGASQSELEYRIVLDGQPGAWFRGMRNAAGAMQFSPDGKRFAYYTIDGNGHAQWFVDGVGQRVFNDVRPLNLATIRGVGVVDPPLPARFSPDGRRFAYFADVVEKGVAIVEDDKPGPLFKGVGLPVFSPDSRHLAYAGETYNKTMALVLDGAIVGEWPASGSGQPIFSSDGARVAMMLERKEGGLFGKHSVWSLVLDGRRVGDEQGEDSSAYPTFSPTGDRVASWVQRKGGQAALVIDGVAQDLPWSVDSDPHFDSQGRLVYAARVGASKTVVVDGRPGPTADEIISFRTVFEAFGRDPWMGSPTPLRMTPGDHVAWGGQFGETFSPVFDDEIGAAFDAIVGCRVDSGVVRWWAQRDDTAYRIERAF